MKAALDSLQHDMPSTGRVVQCASCGSRSSRSQARASMRHDQAAAYADALPGSPVGSDRADPNRCAVIAGRRWRWTGPELFAALDELARERLMMERHDQAAITPERREPARV